VNVPERPAARVDGETDAIPRSSTWPRMPYQVLATRTPVAARELRLLTVPCSSTVPAGSAVAARETSDSLGAGLAAAAVAESLKQLGENAEAGALIRQGLRELAR